MAEQPTDMAGMINSVRDAQRAAQTAVIPTIATHRFMELSTNQRQHLARYMQGAIAEYAGLDQIMPGEVITAAQTDEWYRTHDHKGGFATLVGHAQVVAQRTR